MKKLIITVAILLISISYAYPQSLKSISSSDNKIIAKETLYTNFSLGGSINTNDFKKPASLGFNFGLRHQFSHIFYFEGRFSFIGQMKGWESDLYIFSLIPQWNAYEEEHIKIIIGAGLEFWAAKDGGIILPLGTVKLEYHISKEFFISPEIKALPFSASINFGYRFPFKGYDNVFK